MTDHGARRSLAALRDEGRARTTPIAVPASFEGEAVSEETFVRVLCDAVGAVEKAGIPYGMLGGVASAVLGRPRWTHDADVFVRPIDAGAALETLEEAGFSTQRTNPNWLFKGIKEGV